MTSTTESRGNPEPDRRQWVVEVNFAGCRVLRWTDKRRHLLLKPGIHASR